MATETKQLAGVIGYFNDPNALIAAATKVRDANRWSFDCFTPYAVHGLDQAMGLKRSPLPYVTFLAGLTGCIAGFGLQYWTSVIDWPINVAGKPFNSWPAFIPVTFETTVLFAALSTVGAMFFLNGLPNMKKKAFDTSLTRDRFALVIDAPVQVEGEEAKPFAESEAKTFLSQLGAQDVKTVYAEGWF